MDKLRFREAVVDLHQYFGVDKEASIERVSNMYGQVFRIPDICASYIVDKIKSECDSLPRNIPKKFKEFYQRFKDEKNYQQPIKYDSYEDFRYPVKSLEIGFNMLMDGEKERFENFCKKTGMPDQDRQRIWNKYRFHTEPDFAARIHDIAININKRLEGTDLSLKDIPF